MRGDKQHDAGADDAGADFKFKHARADDAGAEFEFKHDAGADDAGAEFEFKHDARADDDTRPHTSAVSRRR